MHGFPYASMNRFQKTGLTEREQNVNMRENRTTQGVTMLLHVLGFALFAGAGVLGLAAVVGPYRAAMARLQTGVRATPMEARPLPSIEPGPVVPAGQPVRLRRQRRLRRPASVGMSWWPRPQQLPGRPLRPAFAAAASGSF